MEETTPAQPDPPASMPPPTTGPLGAPAQPARARGGCVGRFFAALLVVIITTFLALAAGAAGLLYLGFTPALPGQLAAAQVQVATLQAANSQMQTQVLAADQRGSADHEVLGDLKRQFETIAGLRDQLRQEREASIAQNATLVAEVRSAATRWRCLPLPRPAALPCCPSSIAARHGSSASCSAWAISPTILPATSAARRRACRRLRQRRPPAPRRRRPQRLRPRWLPAHRQPPPRFRRVRRPLRQALAHAAPNATRHGHAGPLSRRRSAGK
ncbi:MAG: hypothetical protein U0Z44_06910 [Kouleothrix sp.]